ncbi:hypothetical protein Ancab_003388 [Ancistrocladus abbreviatus]
MHYGNACLPDASTAQQFSSQVGAGTDLINFVVGDEDIAHWCAATKSNVARAEYPRCVCKIGIINRSCLWNAGAAFYRAEVALLFVMSTAVGDYSRRSYMAKLVLLLFYVDDWHYRKISLGVATNYYRFSMQRELLCQSSDGTVCTPPLTRSHSYASS